ncbi:MAG: D-tyrosyl-tRNA(Tyr) deacylase [Lachnospiraceae bacterium]|nr:D-tyrosyl-tRNA(Tyr) deacylase [Lachnospiraceae bacterium]
MKFVIQRVSEGQVSVDGKVCGTVGRGFVVLVGIGKEDSREIADKMLKKLLGLRIFPDENDKTNLSLKDVGGGLLLISQFTLFADCKHGNRPSFFNAGEPDKAKELYDYIVKACRAEIPEVGEGVFGEHMKLSLVNEGPFTVILDSDEL